MKEEPRAERKESIEPIDTNYLASKVSVHLHLQGRPRGYLKSLGDEYEYHAVKALIGSRQDSTAS